MEKTGDVISLLYQQNLSINNNKELKNNKKKTVLKKYNVKNFEVLITLFFENLLSVLL